MPATLGRAAFGPALALAGVAFVLDQLSKWLMLEWVLQPPRVIEVTGFLNIVQVCNPGISFGLLPGDSDLKPWLLSALALVIAIGVLVWVRRKEGLLTGLAAGMIVGGALGNVVDRLRFGCVFDFIDLYAGTFHWPAFNVADSAITLGVALLLAHGLFFDKQQGK